MRDKNSPIGFFDSGIGGLSVLAYAREYMPLENYIFYGDSGNIPYGEKSPEEIKRLTIAACDKLFEMGAKALLIACNTATSAAIYDMRAKYQIPVISMEPAIKPACEKAAGEVLVMATPSTIKSERYHKLAERLGCEERIYNLPCKGLADLLETGDFKNVAIDVYLDALFAPLKGHKFGAVVIGCTHYSFITEQIKCALKRHTGSEAEVFDGRYGTVHHLKNSLAALDLLREAPGGEIAFHSSGTEENLKIMQKIISDFS
ncbi:MAG: glutamate racemase [Christensenellaceae bacterium]|jgi:glutamate racemase